MNISYYFDEIKARKFYIFGFFLLISLTSISDWLFIGPTIISAQEANILPSNFDLINTLQKAAVIVIFAVSWDLLSGYSGQVSFGHALYLGIGGYLSILFKIGMTINEYEIVKPLENIPFEIMGITMDLSILVAILKGAILSAILSVIIGVFTLRMSGPYFALVTLVLPLIFQKLVRNIWDDYTGGTGGLSAQGNNQLVKIPANTDLQGIEIYFLRIEQQYTVILTIAIICVLIMYIIARSRYGLVLRSIRDDDLAASASGINVDYYKLSAISLSSFFAAIAGGLFVQTLGFAAGSFFDAERSFEVIIYTVLGGIGTIAGGVIGTFILMFAITNYIGEGFIDIPTIEILIFSLILIIGLKYQPRGLVNAKPQLRNALFFATLFSIFVALFETGIILSGLSELINPGIFLENAFVDKEKGLFGINVMIIRGRMILYFLIGSIVGYYGPEVIQKLRLNLWGVWPNLGKFDPPK